MRQCSCDGILHRVSERFHERLLDWAHLPSVRRARTFVEVNETCQQCGRQWRMRFEPPLSPTDCQWTG